MKEYIKNKFKDFSAKERRDGCLEQSDHRCIVCGCSFYTYFPNEYAWKHKKHLFCSYSCMVAYRKVVAPEENANLNNYKELLKNK